MKTTGQQKCSFKWFHIITILLKNHLSYRYFISTWRTSTIRNVVLSDFTQSAFFLDICWRIPTVYFLTCIYLSDIFHSFRHNTTYRFVLFFFTQADTLSHCSPTGVWRYSKKYLTLKDIWRFDNNAPFFYFLHQSSKKCRSSRAKYTHKTAWAIVETVFIFNNVDKSDFFG